MTRRQALALMIPVPCFGQRDPDTLMFWSTRTDRWPDLTAQAARERSPAYGQYRRVLLLLGEALRDAALPFPADTAALLKRLILQAAKAPSFGSLVVAELCSSSLAWSAIRGLRSAKDRESAAWSTIPTFATRGVLLDLIRVNYGKAVASMLAEAPDGSVIDETLNLIDRSGSDRRSAIATNLKALDLLDAGNVPGLLMRIAGTLQMTEVLIPAAYEFARNGDLTWLENDPQNKFADFANPLQKRFGSALAGYGFTRTEMKMLLVTGKTYSGVALERAGPWLE